MQESAEREQSAWRVFIIFLRLGLTSFGGPVAHLAYFRSEFVVQRKWLSESAYADLVALCQFLPGPASSQVGLSLGLMRAGYRGALAAWAGFTLPSALALMALAMGIGAYGDVLHSGLLQGLKVVAVAVVVQALWGMAKNLCPDTQRKTMMLLSAGCVLLIPSVWTQLVVIVLAGLAGLYLFKPANNVASAPLTLSVGTRAGVISLLLFMLLLAGLPLLALWVANPVLAVADAFYRSGSLVFGGGHVVLPLLHAEVVAPGWVSDDVFLAGYGAAQAVPGPLFTFSAFLGASIVDMPAPWIGALLCLVAIFIPSFLLVIGVLPFWVRLQGYRPARAALQGINAAVVGLLLAACYQPVWTSGILTAQHFVLGLAAFVALMFWQWSPWFVVLLSALAGWLFLG